MAKEKLIALKYLRYGGKYYNEGDPFYATRAESQLLRAIKHAKIAPATTPTGPPVAPVVPPPVITPAPPKPVVVETPAAPPKVMATEVKASLTDKPKNDGKEKK